MTTVIVEGPSSTVSVDGDGLLSVVSVGIQGPAGSSAGMAIGGYNVNFTNLVNNDLISFDSSTSAWKNKIQTDLTDGGNF